MIKKTTQRKKKHVSRRRNPRRTETATPAATLPPAKATVTPPNPSPTTTPPPDLSHLDYLKSLVATAVPELLANNQEVTTGPPDEPAATETPPPTTLGQLTGVIPPETRFAKVTTAQTRLAARAAVERLACPQTIEPKEAKKGEDNTLEAGLAGWVDGG